MSTFSGEPHGIQGFSRRRECRTSSAVPSCPAEHIRCPPYWPGRQSSLTRWVAMLPCRIDVGTVEANEMPSAREQLEALRRRVVPQWWSHAKLGIFVHWTPASIPGLAPVGADIGELLQSSEPDVWVPLDHTPVPYDETPVPQVDGDRALHSLCTPSLNRSWEWHSDGHPCPCRCNAHTSSRLPLVILSLPGATPYNPFTAHSQDEESPLRRISASFGTLLASYWIPRNHSTLGWCC